MVEDELDMVTIDLSTICKPICDPVIIVLMLSTFSNSADDLSTYDLGRER
jgi:hypothetical protein